MNATIIDFYCYSSYIFNKLLIQMTENKWLDFAGFLNGCMYKLEHYDCPYRKFVQMDQYQRLELLLTISDEEANSMMSNCIKHQTECIPIMIHKHESNWNLSLMT